MSTTPPAPSIHLGIALFSATSMNAVMDISQLAGFDYCMVNIAGKKDEGLKRQAGDGSLDHGPIAINPYLLSTSSWNSYIVGQVDLNIDLDSSHESSRQQWEGVLREEIQFCGHHGLSAVFLPFPQSPNGCMNYARVVQEILPSVGFLQLCLQVPLSERSWQVWNQFRLFCDSPSNLYVSLQFTEDMCDSKICDLWLGEPVKTVEIPASIFLTNKKGFPVLSKAHKALLVKLMEYNVQVCLTNTQDIEPSALTAYREYLAFLDTSRTPLPAAAQYEKPYWDYLQAPLQPLQDHLESTVYETFEKDPIKYQLYEDAITLALQDITQGKLVPSERHSEPPSAQMDEMKISLQHGSTKGSAPQSALPAVGNLPPSSPNKDSVTPSDSEHSLSHNIVIMVVGAGRGPLVDCARRAAGRTHSSTGIRFIALEKNPNALVTLRRRNISDWNGEVELVASDMRDWDAPVYADILVSELLGSFSDNELSPDCLAPLMKYLKPHGVSIPASYTSYLVPATSEKLHNDIRAYKDLKHLETPYVVKMHNGTTFGELQPCFTYEHKAGADDFSPFRYATLNFQAEQSFLMHGFLGYFDSVLYADIHMSILPANHSPSMVSWFPIFFPLRQPVTVAEGDTVSTSFWRVGDKHKVWYEWTVSSPVALPIHNPMGRSYAIGL